MDTDDKAQLWMEPGTARKRLRVSLGEYKGHRYLDLRRYWRDKEDGTYKPSKEGITLNKERLLGLKQLFAEKAEQINDWLAVGYVPDNVDEEKQRHQKARAVASGQIGQVISRAVADVHDERIFRVINSGGITEVHWNSEHAFCQELNRVTEPDSEVRQLINALVVFYSLSAEDIDTNDEQRSFIAHEWATRLQTHLENKAMAGGDENASDES